MKEVLGIDYGAQRAGTTRICAIEDDKLTIYRSCKKQSADAFVLNLITDLAPEMIGIDAPLSLPKAYYGQGSDFHYRVSDRVLGAMSPMFLGGLTARAMSLTRQLDIGTVEVYPAARVRANATLTAIYNKKDKSTLPLLVAYLSEQLQREISEIQDYHDIDSILAWWISSDFLNQKAKCAGEVSEGLIYY